MTSREERSALCTARHVETDEDGQITAWMFAPQVEGYSAHLKVTTYPSPLPEGTCFEIEWYHDGEFPADEPVYSHGCAPLKWVRAAARIAKLQGVPVEYVVESVREAMR